MKINKILLPFDDSVHSINAAKYALDLAKQYEAHITVVHCYDEWDTNLAEISSADSLITEIREPGLSDLRCWLDRMTCFLFCLNHDMIHFL